MYMYGLLECISVNELIYRYCMLLRVTFKIFILGIPIDNCFKGVKFFIVILNYMLYYRVIELILVNIGTSWILICTSLLVNIQQFQFNNSFIIWLKHFSVSLHELWVKFISNSNILITVVQCFVCNQWRHSCLLPMPIKTKSTDIFDFVPFGLVVKAFFFSSQNRFIKVLPNLWPWRVAKRPSPTSSATVAISPFKGK